MQILKLLCIMIPVEKSSKMLCSTGMMVLFRKEYMHLQFHISVRGIHGFPEVHLGEPSRGLEA